MNRKTADPQKIRTDISPEVKPKKRRISVRKAELPLPKPFELPTNFTPNIKEGLENESLNGKTRGKFITAIAQAIYRCVPMSFMRAVSVIYCIIFNV